MRKFRLQQYINKRLKNMKIMRQFLLSFFCVSIIPLILVGISSFEISSHIVQNKAQSYAFETIQQLSNNVDAMLRQTEMMSLSIAYNGTVQSTLSHLPEEKKISRMDLFALEQNMIMSFDYSTMRDITILSATGNYFRVPYAIDSYANEAISIYADSLSPHRCTWINNSGNGVIEMLRPIESSRDFTRIGTLELSVYSSVIDKQISNINFNKSGRIMVLDQQLNPITAQSTDTSILNNVCGEFSGDFGSFKQKVDGKNMLFFYQTSSMTGWKTVGMISMDKLFHEVTIIGSVVFGCIVFVSILAIFVSRKISQMFSKRIKNVIGSMQKVASGDFFVQLPIKSTNEFGQLNEGFNLMVTKINSLIDTVYKFRLLQQESELKALQAQINPHFLYNTLNVICWQAKICGREEICKTVIALADLLRASVDNKQSFISIEQEVKYIEDYILIQKTRYRNKIQVIIDIDDRLNNILIPKLIIQPVIENAFIHGLEMKKGPGTIHITGMLNQCSVCFEVKDNGMGMSPEQVNAIFEKRPDGKSSLGLMNVHKRIQLVYGEKYGITVESELGKGTLVRIVFPPSASSA